MNTNRISLPSNKRFGIFFCIVFILLALYFYVYAFFTYAIVFLSISILFLLAVIFKDSLLLPLNKAWMQLGVLLSRIVSPIILAFLFFVMFTPIALGMRIFRRDELRLRMLNIESFWKYRNKQSDKNSSFTQQF